MAGRQGAAQAAPAAPAAAHPSQTPRWGEPDRVYVVTDSRGVSASVQADADGVVYPSSPEEVRICDALGLPLTIDPRPETPAEQEA